MSYGTTEWNAAQVANAAQNSSAQPNGTYNPMGNNYSTISGGIMPGGKGGRINQNNGKQMHSGGVAVKGGPQVDFLRRPRSDQYSPMQPAQQPFDVNQAAAGGLQQAMQGTQAAMQGPNIGQFMNPYTQQVTQNTLADLERQRQMQMNTMGTQASRAGAFGGSRHGVAEALTNEAFARQGAQTFGNLQQQGFNTALGAAQNQQQMQMGGAAQTGALAGQAFNTGQAIQDRQERQGLLQQGLQQALIDAAKQQYGGYAGAPQAALSAPIDALGATPQQQYTETKSQSPGLLSYLQAFGGMG